MENSEKLFESASSEMEEEEEEEDTEEAKLDNHFRALLRRYDGHHKSFAYNSDRIIIDKWLEIFRLAPAAEKMSRNALMLLLQGHLADFGLLKEPFTDMRNCSKDLNSVLDNYQGISMGQCEGKESTESDMSERSVCPKPSETNSSSSEQGAYLEPITEVSAELASSDQDRSSAVTVIRNKSQSRTALGRCHPSNDNVMQKIQSFEELAQRTQGEAALDPSKGSDHLLNFRKVLAKRITSYNRPRLTQGEPLSAGMDEYASLRDLKFRFEQLAKRLGVPSPPKAEQPTAETLKAASSLGEQIRMMAECNQPKEAATEGTRLRIAGGAEHSQKEQAKMLTQRSWERRSNERRQAALKESVSTAPSLGEKIRIIAQRKDEPEGGAENRKHIMPRSLAGKQVRFMDQRSWDQCFKDAKTGCETMEEPNPRPSMADQKQIRRCKDAATEWTPRDVETTVKPSRDEQISGEAPMEPRFKDATTEWTPRDGERAEKSSPKPPLDDGEKSSEDAKTGSTPRGCEVLEDQKQIRSERHKEPHTKDATTEWTPRDGESNLKPQLEDQKQIWSKAAANQRTEQEQEEGSMPSPSVDERVRMLTKRNEELRRQCLEYYHEDGRLRQSPADGAQFKFLLKGFESGVLRGMQRLRRWSGAPHSLKFFSAVFSKCQVGVGHSRLRCLDRRLEQMASRWLQEQMRLRRERVWSLYRQSVCAKSEPILTPRSAKELDQLFETRKATLLEEMAHTAKLKELWVEHCLGKIRDQQLQQVLGKLDEKYMKLVKGLNKLVRRQEKLSRRNARPRS
ncbi:uncharacterized protein LOC111069664 [Drosophila obscura]|uniref:uncharacterized protein LOC111069664 n=1 Tax=Drosophila obscura TaxID=7282 RepID=UPI001BB1FF88|nr:uncharacterized protein LOC111069664 [Drosophila obscura]